MPILRIPPIPVTLCVRSAEHGAGRRPGCPAKVGHTATEVSFSRCENCKVNCSLCLKCMFFHRALRNGAVVRNLVVGRGRSTRENAPLTIITAHLTDAPLFPEILTFSLKSATFSPGAPPPAFGPYLENRPLGRATRCETGGLGAISRPLPGNSGKAGKAILLRGVRYLAKRERFNRKQ